jgi:hypothetical protein
MRDRGTFLSGSRERTGTTTGIKRNLNVSDFIGQGVILDGNGPPEILEDFTMGTTYFLIFIGLGAFAVVWASRRSNAAHDLKKRSASTSARQPFEKLTPTSHDVFSRKEEIWEARRDYAQKQLSNRQQFVPKSVASAEPQYDLYSRRDRHHLIPNGQVAKEANIEEIDEALISPIDFGSETRPT